MFGAWCLVCVFGLEGVCFWCLRCFLVVVFVGISRSVGSFHHLVLERAFRNFLTTKMRRNLCILITFLSANYVQ